MDRVNTATSPADRLCCAMELSKNSWLLGIQFPDRQKASVYPIKGGDSQGLMAKLLAACDRWTKVSGKKPSIILCYEAGYDAFWLARFLKTRGIECLVVDSASMQINRRSRRAKTDRIDLAKLLRVLPEEAVFVSSHTLMRQGVGGDAALGSTGKVEDHLHAYHARSARSLSRRI